MKRLRYEHAIEWVLMQRRKGGNLDRVHPGNRQHGKARRFNGRENLRGVCIEIAEGGLDKLISQIDTALA